MNDSKVQFRNRRISIDGENFRLLAGTMHYFRVPRAAWRNRLEKAKELGLRHAIAPGRAIAWRRRRNGA